MRALAYLIPYVFSIILVAGMYYLNLYTNQLWYIFLALTFIFLIFWWLVIQKKNISREQFVIFLSPLLFLLSSFAFYVLADSVLLKRALVVFLVIGLFVVFRALYFFHWKSVKYQPFSLQTQIRYLNIISIFYSASFLYSLETFLNIPLWLDGLIMFLLIGLFNWQNIFLQKLRGREKVYSGIFSFVISQIFIVIGFLPFLVFVKGFLFLVVYFVFNELYQASITGLWKKKETFLIISSGLVLFVLVLITTKWF